MKCELKDKVLHQRLDRLSDGDFSKRLNELTLDGFSPEVTFAVKFGRSVGYCHRFLTVFQVKEILIHEEYDASKWNSYPKVVPPENVPLRIEIRRASDNHQTVQRLCAQYVGSSWYTDDVRPIFINQGDDVQFTSWE